MILITGAAGFIGSVLARELNQSGRNDLIIVDRLGTGSLWQNIRQIDYYDYCHADELFTTDKGKKILDKVTLIYHMGAISSTTEKDVDLLMKNNVEYSQLLFEFAAGHNIPMIYASSAATYGDGELGYKDDHSLASSLRPLNPYGYSKYFFDKWALAQGQSTPKHWFGVKFFNVFGPNEYHKEDMRSLVNKAYDQILSDGKVKLFKSHREGFEDGKQLRDFIYVKDVVSVLMLLADPKCANHSGLINLGTGQARSFYDLVVSTFKSMGKSENVEFIDMPMSLREQYQYFTEADMSKFNKIKEEVGFNFEFMSLEDAVKDYVQNYLMKKNKFH